MAALYMLLLSVNVGKLSALYKLRIERESRLYGITGLLHRHPLKKTIKLNTSWAMKKNTSILIELARVFIVKD